MYKVDLGLNSLQDLIYHKKQPTDHHIDWKSSWYNGYHRREWTRLEFKSWMRHFTIYIAQISIGKGWKSTILPPVIKK